MKDGLRKDRDHFRSALGLRVGAASMKGGLQRDRDCTPVLMPPGLVLPASMKGGPRREGDRNPMSTVTAAHRTIGRPR